RAYRPDLVHIHFGYTTITTGSGYPRVVSFYGDDLNGESTGGSGRVTFKSRVGCELSQWAASTCERSIAVSEWLRGRLRSAVARERCSVIRDAVDTTLFCPGDQRAARSRLGIDPHQLLVLFPHSLQQRTKRIDLARAAVDALNDAGTPAALWVVNDRHP